MRRSANRHLAAWVRSYRGCDVLARNGRLYPVGGWRGSGSSSAQPVESCSRLETGDIRLDHHRADATIRGTN